MTAGRDCRDKSQLCAQDPDMAVTKWSKIGHQLGVQSGDNILGNSLPKPQSSGLGPQPFLGQD